MFFSMANYYLSKYMINYLDRIFTSKFNFLINNLHRKRIWLLGSFSGYFCFLFNLVVNNLNSSRYPNEFITLLSGLTLSLILLYITLIDIYTMQIPRKLYKIGVLCGLFYLAIIAVNIGWPSGLGLFADHIFAAILSLVVIKALKYCSENVLGQEALGQGDANIVAMGGIWLGSLKITLAMGLAFVLAGGFSFVALILGKLKPLDAFPFAPFISAAILSVWLFEPKWWLSQWLDLWSLIVLKSF